MEEQPKNNEQKEKPESIDGLANIYSQHPLMQAVKGTLAIIGAIGGGITAGLGSFIYVSESDISDPVGAAILTGMGSMVLGTLIGGAVGDGLGWVVEKIAKKEGETSDYRENKDLVLKVLAEQGVTEDVKNAFKTFGPTQVAAVYIEHMHGQLQNEDAQSALSDAFDIRNIMPKKYVFAADNMIRNYLYDLPDYQIEPLGKAFKDMGIETNRFLRLGDMYFKKFGHWRDVEKAEEFYQAADHKEGLRNIARLHLHHGHLEHAAILFKQLSDRNGLNVVANEYMKNNDGATALRIRNIASGL